MTFDDLPIGAKFTIYTTKQIFEKIEGRFIDEGDFGGYIYNARTNGELVIIGSYIEVYPV